MARPVHPDPGPQVAGRGDVRGGVVELGVGVRGGVVELGVLTWLRPDEMTPAASRRRVRSMASRGLEPADPEEPPLPAALLCSAFLRS